MLGAASASTGAGHHATYNPQPGAPGGQASAFSLLSRLTALAAQDAGASAAAARRLRSSAFAVLLSLNGVRQLSVSGAALLSWRTVQQPEDPVRWSQAEYDEVRDRAKANSTTLASVRSPQPDNTSLVANVFLFAAQPAVCDPVVVTVC